MAKNTSNKKTAWSNWRILGALIVILAVGGGVYLLYPRDTPSAAYKRLYSAVKEKNTEAIKKELTKSSVDFGAMFAERSGKTLEQAYENGFTATTFSPMLPEIRDERTKNSMGAVEVYNSKDRTWEDLPFMYEDGAWKLAVGDVFAGTYVKPGEGRSYKEREAANAAGNSGMQQAPMPNMNVPVMPILPSNATTNSNTGTKKK